MFPSLWQVVFFSEGERLLEMKTMENSEAPVSTSSGRVSSHAASEAWLMSSFREFRHWAALQLRRKDFIQAKVGFGKNGVHDNSPNVQSRKYI